MQSTFCGQSHVIFPFVYLQDPPKRLPGVYAIMNTRNGKFYIGSSNSVSHRLSQHKHELNRATHNNPYLLNAWQIEPDAFRFVVILYCDDYLKQEQQLLDLLYDNHNICYNLSATATHPTFSPETIQLISSQMKELHRQNPSRREALINYNKTPDARKLHSEFAKKQRQDPTFAANLAAMVSRTKQKYHDVWLLDPQEQKWHIGWNLAKFAKTHHLNQANLSKMINGKAKSHLGWRLYQQENPQISLLVR